MELLEVYNLRYERKCILNDNTPLSAKNIKPTIKINSISELSFEMPLKSKKWIYIIPEELVKFKGEYYFIKNINYEHTIEKKTVQVQCKHLCSALEKILNPQFKLIGKAGTELFTSVLQDSGWNIGTLDIPVDKYRSIIEENEQPIMTNLLTLAELFEGYLIFNSETRTVNLVANSNAPNRNIQIRLRKNLKSITAQYDTSEMVTRLYPFGGEDVNGLITDIIPVNPTGKSYIENYEWFLAQGYAQTEIDAHPELFKKELVWQDSNYKEPTDLYNDAAKKLLIISKPKISCKVTMVELSNMSPMIGEKITIIDEDMNLTFETQATSISQNYDNPSDVSIDVDNVIEYSSILKKLVDTTKYTPKFVAKQVQQDVALDTTNTNLSNLTDTVDTLSLTVDQTNESLTITAQDLRDADNALDGKIDITATSLTSDYSQKISTVDGKVETNTSDITQNAQNIELKVAKDGIINAINLSAEALTIDVNKIDISNAVIGWTQLNGAPTDNTALATTLNSYVSNSSLATELASYITTGTFSNTLQNYVTGSGLTTILGQDYIITGKLLANQIDAGQLNGVTIRTSNTTNYVTMQDQYIDIYNGDTKKIHIGYDYWNGTSYEASLEFENNKIYANSSGFRFQPGGASCLFMYNDGTAAFGNDLKITGDLEVLGAVSFPTSTFTVTAKFA